MPLLFGMMAGPHADAFRFVVMGGYTDVVIFTLVGFGIVWFLYGHSAKIKVDQVARTTGGGE